MDTDQLADRFFRLVEAGDAEAVAAVITPDATVWHNDGSGEEPMARSSQVMIERQAQLEGMRYETVRRFVDGDEVLQQHVLHLVPEAGPPLEIHAAMYLRFRDGLLERLEEYATLLPPRAPEDRPA